MLDQIRYPYLPDGKEIKYVSIDNPNMILARDVAKKESTDMLQPTGAVVVLNNKIISSGANNTFLGKNKYLNKKHQKGICIRKLFKVPSGKGYWMCPGCVPNQRHAESQAIKNALKNSPDISGSDLYLWGHWWCCQTCWDNMINAGIRNVYLLDNSYDLFSRDSKVNILGKQFLK